MGKLTERLRLASCSEEKETRREKQNRRGIGRFGTRADNRGECPRKRKKELTEREGNEKKDYDRAKGCIRPIRQGRPNLKLSLPFSAY